MTVWTDTSQEPVVFTLEILTNVRMKAKAAKLNEADDQDNIEDRN
jgi:hypothetical protein